MRQHLLNDWGRLVGLKGRAHSRTRPPAKQGIERTSVRDPGSGPRRLIEAPFFCLNGRADQEGISTISLDERQPVRLRRDIHGNVW